MNQLDDKQDHEAHACAQRLHGGKPALDARRAPCRRDAQQHAQRRGQRARPEDEHGDEDQKVREQDVEQQVDFGEPRLVLRRRQQALDDLQRAVEHAPGDVLERRAVPQARDGVDDHQVSGLLELAAAARAQREIDVIAEPGRQADVPSGPEVLHGVREVRLAEVGHQLHTQHLRRADGDVAVAREIAQVLHGKHERRQRDLRAGCVDPAAVNRIDVHARAVRDDHLLKEAQQHDQKALPRAFPVKAVLRRHLPEQAAAALDRAGDQLRKERHEQRVFEQVTFSLHAPLVHVDHIGQRLEDVEADAHRQKNRYPRRGHRDGERIAHALHHVQKKACILEVPQQADVEDDAGEHRKLLVLLLRKRRDDAPARIRYDRTRRHQQRVFRVPVHVEEVAHHQQPDPLDFSGQQEVDRRDDREENQELK